MATVDELLAAETTESDDELSFLIDEHLRIITVPERGVVLGVEGDKDVNRVRFRMNRYYHGSDLSSFQIRINYQNADGEANYFTVSEKTVDTDTFSFVWVVAADAVMTKGTVLFVVNCFTTDSSDVVQKAYHTTLGAASVLEGLEVDVEGNQPQIVDFLAKLKNELTVHAGTVLQQMDAYAKSAESSKTAASNYADAAGKSASSAAGSASAAAGSASSAAGSASSASSSAVAAGSSATAAKTSEGNAATSATAAGNSATAAQSSATAAKTSETNAGSSAAKAATSATAASNSATAASSAATKAGDSASAAKASEGNAKTSETEAAAHLQGTKEYFEQVRTITIGAQGWYATPEALKAAVPVGENGWWAVVGTTDTIWTWDGDTGAWADTQAKVDLSDYLTQTQIKALLAKYMPLRAATTTVLGGIKVGDNLSIDADGKLNGAAPYALTAAKVTAALGFTPTRIISSTDAPPSDVSAYPDGTLWITYSTSASADEAVDDTDIHIPDDETVADDSADTPEDTVQDETAVTKTTTVISDDAEPEEG